MARSSSTFERIPMTCDVHGQVAWRGDIRCAACGRVFLQGPEISRPSNRSFAQMAGYVTTNIGVAVIGDHLRKKGLEPREVAAEDLERTSSATEEAIVRAIGDAEVPWWAPHPDVCPCGADLNPPWPGDAFSARPACPECARQQSPPPEGEGAD